MCMSRDLNVGLRRGGVDGNVPGRWSHAGARGKGNWVVLVVNSLVRLKHNGSEKL